MKAALLPDRGVVKVAGDRRPRPSSTGWSPTDIDQVTPGAGAVRRAADPQGKIIVDFIVAEAPAEDGGGFFLDCPRALAPALVAEAQLLQAARQGDLSRTCPRRWACWRSGTARGDTEYGLVYADPRLPALGQRIMLPPHLARRRRPISAPS